jgi:hypothetical protein
VGGAAHWRIRATIQPGDLTLSTKVILSATTKPPTGLENGRTQRRPAIVADTANRIHQVRPSSVAFVTVAGLVDRIRVE